MTKAAGTSADFKFSLESFVMASSDAPKPSSSFDDDDDEVEQLQYKIILLGDGAVGTWRCDAIFRVETLAVLQCSDPSFPP
jgi:hypothetical protein